MYWNSHTHQASRNAIFNLYPKEEVIDQYYSVGIHPWFLDDLQKQKELLVEKSKQKNCIAIGECGLDRIHKSDIETQKDTFIFQIKHANSIQKPLIIHCVKAYDLLAQIFKNHPPTVPVIFHGFNQKTHLLKDFEKIDLYISLGAALLQDNSNAQKTLKEFDLNRIFFETDDHKDIMIEEVYKKASELLNLPPEKIETQIHTNINTVFHVEL